VAAHAPVGAIHWIDAVGEANGTPWWWCLRGELHWCSTNFSYYSYYRESTGRPSLLEFPDDEDELEWKSQLSRRPSHHCCWSQIHHARARLKRQNVLIITKLQEFHCSMPLFTILWQHGEWSLTKLHVWEARLLMDHRGFHSKEMTLLAIQFWILFMWHFFRNEEYPSLGSLSLWPTQCLFAFTFSTILGTNSQSHKHSSSCWLKSSSCPPSCCCCCLSLSCSCSNWCRCSYYHYDDHHCPSPLFPPYCNKVWPHTFAIIGDDDIES